jgi:hypothetical protein
MAGRLPIRQMYEYVTYMKSIIIRDTERDRLTRVYQRRQSIARVQSTICVLTND